MIAEYAREWIGTPFHLRGRVKGAGVDCCQLIIDVLSRSGVITPIDLPVYRLNKVSDPAPEMMQILLMHLIPPHQLIPVRDIVENDLLICKFGQRMRHISVATSAHTHVDVSIQQGVQEREITQSTLSKLHQVLRIT